MVEVMGVKVEGVICSSMEDGDAACESVVEENYNDMEDGGAACEMEVEETYSNMEGEVMAMVEVETCKCMEVVAK